MLVLLGGRQCAKVSVCFEAIVYDNGRLVKEADDYYADDGDDECFTQTMMIITIVVSVVHPSVIV